MSNTSARILAIDDDDAILSLLADALSPPHQVATAQEWLDGVDLLMNQQFDLLIIDLGMPVFNSVEFVNKIRASPPYDRIPILVISAYPQLRERLREFPVQAILPKPFSLENLTRTVAELLHGQPATMAA
ncbi:MAG: response regulator [Chloroflexota bacterium]